MANSLKLSRRSVLKLSGGAIAATTVGLPHIAQAKPDQLVISDGGGILTDAFRKGYYDTFTSKTGIKIVNAPYAGIGKVKLMVESNNVDIDVVSIDASEGAVAEAKGLLEPIDWSLSDRSSLLPNTSTAYSVVDLISATVICWNTAEFTDGKVPRTWADTFDTQNFPGKRSFWKNASQTLELALLADGVSGDKLYPLDIDRAFKKLDSIKDQIAWYEHGAQSVQLVADGESSLGSTWNGRAYQPKLDGAPVDYTFSNNFLVFGSWTMPKGGKNTKWAQEFIAHTLDPKNQAIVSENVPYIAPAKKTMELLSAERKAVLPDLSQGTWQNVSFWAEHGDAIYERFTAWLIG